MTAQGVAALLLSLAAAISPALAQSPDSRRSGTSLMSAPLQAMQQDDTQNPAMLWVKDGEAAWQQRPPNGKPACIACHGDAAQTMRGMAARYPAFDERLARPINLQQRINQCRERHQALPPLALEHRELLQLESFLANPSRGLPISPPPDPRLAPWRERGAALYQSRMGQLNLSCAQCHDQLAGQRLGGSLIPQAHPTAYPVYRLEWQGLGSLQRRLRGCATGVRAEPFAWGSAEMLQLELYLSHRASGMPLESPGVRP